jgi:hypothetical protein
MHHWASEALPNEVTKDIMTGVTASEDSTCMPLLLRAFWATYKAQLKLHPVPCRLLINPPLGLALQDEANHTITTQPWLRGHYGREYLPRKNGGFFGPPFFDDVAIFLGGVESGELASRVAPGSTVTLARPNKGHDWWVGLASEQLKFDQELESIKKKFNLRQLFHKDEKDVEIEIYGVEAQ